MTNRPVASISIDLDNLWSYLRTHGDPGWERRPSYLARAVPIVLDAFDRAGVRATFFVVGADAELPGDRSALRRIADAGHEIGNHSHEHEPWLDRYGRDRLAAEVERAETAIAEATGERPRGFRAPGYSWAHELPGVLAERGYLYDGSTLPTFIGPLARAYYFRSARLSPAERHERAGLFGRFRDGFGRLGAHPRRLPDGATLVEIPVTTHPVFRTPIHLSYLLYLTRIRGGRPGLALAYFRSALAACRAAGIAPSFLLHPLDFLGPRDAPGLEFFPAMDLATETKVWLFTEAVALLAAGWRLGPMRDHAAAVLDARAAAVGSAGRPPLAEPVAGPAEPG